MTLSALSWDLADWNWKQNHDAGLFYEHLFAADLSKSKRNGGKHPFYADAWLPSDAIRGELAESWEWKDNPLRIEIKLRKGIMFPEKPGVMAARELTAEDVLFSYNRLANESEEDRDLFRPRREGPGARSAYGGVRVQGVQRRVGLPLRLGLLLGHHAQGGRRRRRRQLEERQRHRAVHAERLRAGQFEHLRRRIRNYWDKEKIGGADYKLPFVDKLVYRTIKDEATFITALRTAKIDMLENIRWQNVEQLKKSAPTLQWSKWLSMSGQFLAMRVDTKPFDDIRVRRALNMAVNKQEIVSALLQRQRRAVRLSAASRLPRLLRAAGADAGLGEGAVRLRSRQGQEAAGRSRLSERLQLQGAGLLVQSRPHGAAAAGRRLSGAGRRQDRDPADGVRRVPVRDDHEDQRARLLHEQRPHQPDHHDPQELHQGPGVEPLAVERSRPTKAKMDEVYRTRDEEKRIGLIRDMTREILDKAPYIWLPTPYIYTAWWPWVKNYGGELRAGAVRPGPIYARIWVDQELKKKMGY